MEEIARSWPSVNNPKARPNQKHNHHHAAELGEARFEPEQPGRELDLANQPDRPDAKTHQGDGADHHPGKLWTREREQARRVGPVRSDEERCRPCKGSESTWDETLMRPGVAPGPWPTVCEVAATEDEDPGASHHEDQRPHD